MLYLLQNEYKAFYSLHQHHGNYTVLHLGLLQTGANPMAANELSFHFVKPCLH